MNISDVMKLCAEKKTSGKGFVDFEKEYANK